MYFPDLTLCRYSPGPLHAADWKVSLFAVGWLKRGHDFSRGTVPSWLVHRLRRLLEQTRKRFPDLTFRGVHACTLCADCHGLPDSNINVWIPGEDVVYAAPAGILHYIEAHTYTPPQAFIDAVQVCPDVDSPAYLLTLRTLNAGLPSPLEQEPTYLRTHQGASVRQKMNNVGIRMMEEAAALNDFATFFTRWKTLMTEE